MVGQRANLVLLREGDWQLYYDQIIGVLIVSMLNFFGGQKSQPILLRNLIP